MVHKTTILRVLFRTRFLREYPMSCKSFCSSGTSGAYGCGLKVRMLLHRHHSLQKRTCSFLRFHRYVSTSSTSHSSEDSDSDSDLDVSEFSSSDPDSKESEKQIRNILYPSSEDPIICNLKECASVQEVFDVVEQFQNEFSGVHASQAVLVLRELQKAYHSMNVKELSDSHIDISDHEDPETLLSEFVGKINSHECFQTLLGLIENTIPELTVDAATCTLLYLNRMGVPLTESLMEKLITHCQKLFDDMGSNTPLSSVSRYTVALNHKMKNSLELIKLLPVISSLLGNTLSVEELHLLTICVHKIGILLHGQTLEMYKKKVHEMLENGCFTPGDGNTIIKIALFLNIPYWSWRNIDLIKNLLQLLKGNMSLLSTEDLVLLYRVFQNQLEPANILADLQEQASVRLGQIEIMSSSFYTATRLLCCVASFGNPQDKKTIEEITFERLENLTSPLALPVLFRIIRNLKTSNIDLCNAFWSKAVDVMIQNPQERKDYKLLKFCHRYMHFNNNLGGTYRHAYFENRMIEWVLELMQTDIITSIPSKFARSASFLIAYGSQKTLHYPSTLTMVVEKLKDMSYQLTEIDCLIISRGYQIAMHMHPGLVFKQNVLSLFVELDSLLNTCAQRHLEKTKHSFPAINILMRTYLNRRSPLDTDVFQNLIERYESMNGEISSRLLRDAVYNFHSSSCLIPKTLDWFSDYIISNKDHLLGDTIEKLLYASFGLGHTPERVEEFLDASVEILTRDKERMDGISLMQAALALCYYQYLPENLVHFIFTVQFLERLDKEIAYCYSKLGAAGFERASSSSKLKHDNDASTYSRENTLINKMKISFPARLRNLMMQLNRAVCLDYPEVDVPWFHKKYIEQQQALESAWTSIFYKEVKNVLVNILGANYLVGTNVFSPYGYKIDFEILMDERTVPVAAKHRTDKNISKIAVLLLDDEAFTHNVRVLKGPYQMKLRHLEILGYKVLTVSSTVWNSMYMSEPGAKHEFLKEKIWPHQALSESQYNL